jgi:alpha-tubulin suppressor-like RCC1 family protein
LLIPKKLDLSIKVEKALCGGNFTIIMDDKNRLYSFGDNRYGQLGITGLNNIVLEHPAGI